MLNVGAGEIVLIMVLALLILGPKRLPELARGIGKFMREFRRQTEEVRTVVEREFYKMDQELEKLPTAAPGAWADHPSSDTPGRQSTLLEVPAATVPAPPAHTFPKKRHSASVGFDEGDRTVVVHPGLSAIDPDATAIVREEEKEPASDDATVVKNRYGGEVKG